MILDYELKLDFKDVLIRPKRSTLTSRKEVELKRKYNFRNAKLSTPHKGHNLISDYEGIPIMASNMDGVGTFKIAERISKSGLFTCLTKTYNENELIKFFKDTNISDYVAVSIGISEFEVKKFSKLYKAVGKKIKYVCIDVANGYTELFSDFIINFRKKYPNIARNNIWSDIIKLVLATVVLYIAITYPQKPKDKIIPPIKPGKPES